MTTTTTTTTTTTATATKWDAVEAGRVRADFDEIARLAEPGESGADRYDAFLRSLVPAGAVEVLDVGCGLGRLTASLAAPGRRLLGVDLSPAMIERARLEAPPVPGATFEVCDFLGMEFGGGRSFDCVISAAALHHMSADAAVPRMVSLLRPGGRLIIHDLRRDTRPAETLRACTALAQVMVGRLLRTGRPRPTRLLRRAWARHGAGESYLSLADARAMAGRLLPGARVFDHWMWRYTVVWEKTR